MEKINLQTATRKQFETWADDLDWGEIFSQAIDNSRDFEVCVFADGTIETLAKFDIPAEDLALTVPCDDDLEAWDSELDTINETQAKIDLVHWLTIGLNRHYYIENGWQDIKDNRY